MEFVAVILILLIYGLSPGWSGSARLSRLPMEFFSVVLILLVYYIRPQDWVSGLIGVGIVTPIMGMAIFAMVSRAKQEGRKLDFLRTPLDWAALALYAFIVVTHPYPYGAFKDAMPLFAFYFVTVQALRTPDRLRSYLVYWLIALTVLALFGVLSKFGVDPTGAVGMTEANKGRLALGTWMHNNPNSLGHSVIIIIPLAYFLFFWKSGITKKLVAVALWVLAYECVFMTESKGAVVAGFGTLVLAYVFGKSKLVQILVLTAAVAGGGAAVSVMPRMNEMSSLRSDEGVQGRLLAWEQARTASRNSFTGQGWKTFRATIRWQKLWLNKATHSGYVQVGAELGPLGMAIYVGFFWLAFRSLIRCKTRNLTEEVCRRCLFALLVGFAISNWMIDRAYHTELFLFLAAISALHRMILLDPTRSMDNEAEKESATEMVLTPAPLFPWQPQPALAMAGSGSFSMSSVGAAVGRPSGSAMVAVPKLPKVSLSRPTLLDVGVAIVGATVVFFIWDYVLRSL